MIRLLKYFRWYYWVLIIAVIGMTIAQVYSDLVLIEKLEEIANHATIYGQSEMIRIGLTMLGFAAISMVCTISVGFISSKIAAGFSHDLREVVYRKVQNFSMEEMDEFSTASLITRSTNDVTQVQNVIVMTLRIAISAPITAILAISNVIGKTSQLTTVLIISVLVLIVLVIIIFIIIAPQFKKIQRLTDRLNLVTRENLTGLRVVRAYNAQDIEESKFNDVNTEITKKNIFVNRVASVMQPGMYLIMNLTSLAIVWVGALLFGQGIIAEGNGGEILSFQQYSMKIVISFMQLTLIAIMLPRGSVSGKRINEVLRKESKIVDPDVAKTQDTNLEGTVEFKDVSFTYPGASEAVLENINLNINQGETVAFIGSTGSGKSTLINLVPRFFEVTSGAILVNGQNIRDYNQKDLRDLIGYIPQRAILFSGTIGTNLKYGNQAATEADMDFAVEVAQAKEFVDKLDQKYDYPIARGGTNVSGGQKQRLSIARAVMKKPQIYIFDDSFSALDFKTDKALREALNNATGNATNLIVAQRIGTIINADKIVVLDQGKIVGIGTHKELLKNCSVYQEIAYSQLSKEELADE